MKKAKAVLPRDCLEERSRKFRTMLRRVARDRRGAVTLEEYRKRAKA